MTITSPAGELTARRIYQGARAIIIVERDEWVLAVAAAAEVQVIEPDDWETANVTTVTTIEHA